MPMQQLPLLIITFLSLGLAWSLWQQHQQRQKLEQLTSLLPGGFELASAFDPLYRLRRGIEELVIAQQEIGAQQVFWQSLLEQAPCGYLQVDANNYLLWCNPMGHQLLHIDRWQVGQVRLLLEVVRSYELDRLIEKTRQTQQPQTREWVYQMTEMLPTEPNATTYQVALASSSIVLPEGQVGVFLQNRQPIVDAVQTRDRTFADLAHEFRTPLTAICLVTETLQMRLQDPERQWLAQMQQELDRLMALIEDSLDLSRLADHPQASLSLEVCLIRPQLESVWQTLKPLATQQSVTWQYTESTMGLKVRGDPRRLMQVWFNLMDNALKYSPLNSKIVVNVTDEEETVCIDIIDCGQGFKSTDLKYVFERLYRGDPARLREVSTPSQSGVKREGNGLGLSITQQIIHAHDGTISAQNHPQTQGGWLQVKLPKVH